MNQAELTPHAGAGYDEYMDQSMSEQQTAQQPTEEVLPGPVSEAARSLYRNAKRGTESGETPESQTDAYQFARAKLEKEGRRSLTRDELKRVAQTVQDKTPAGILMDAQFVNSAAKTLVHNIKSDVENRGINQKVLDELEKSDVLRQVEELTKFIASNPPDGETTKEESSASRDELLRGRAATVAKLADTISSYYERAKLSREIDDPFRQVVSFEELMTKFNITLDDDRFRPGGEFELMSVTEKVDQYGRNMSEETAHPENFLRWVTERAWFYHDFDPMAEINLFEGMYLVAGTRKVSMYEMLVDFNAYFSHRVPTTGELKVLQEDFLRAKDQGIFQFTKDYENPRTRESADIIGYYIDPKTGQQTGEYIKNIAVYDEQRRQHVFAVYRDEKNEQGAIESVPVQAILANKEAWETKPKYFEEAQGEIMYQLWLMTSNHNYDVKYRQKGMPSEKPLSETLAEIYSDNKWTRTHRRLLGIFNMPATTYRGDVDKDGKPVNEAAMIWSGEKKGQGTLGKAVQRSIAAYYHISEANAAFNGYTVEGLNPFFEVLKGKGGTNGAEVFYKSLIKRTLEDKKFGYAYNEQNPEKSPVVTEFIHLLNETRIPRNDGTTRKRFDWEKADIVDFLMLNKNEFLTKMGARFVTQADIDSVVRQLRDKYGKQVDDKGKPNALYDPKRLSELQELLTDTTHNKTVRFFDSLKGKSGIGDSAYEKDGFIYKYLHGEYAKQKIGQEDLQNLSGLAVALFVQTFPKEFTPDINPYVNIRYSLDARERMRSAMRDALTHTEKLDEFDAKWAEEWAYTFTFHTGISARNDMMGIGHDAWSKIQNTEFYRLRQSGGGNYPGNLDNLYGIHRLGTDFWQGLKVQREGRTNYDVTLYEVLTGLERHGDSYAFNINKDVGDFEFAGNAMRQFYADHVSHAIDLFIDITSKQELNLDKLVDHDSFGRLIWKNEEMEKIINSTWKHLRYGFDNNGFLYDNVMYGWLYDEKMNDKGQVSRKPHFGLMTLRELMFSKEVREMNMYAREDNSSWSGESVYHTKMGRNVFAYLIAAQLREHTRYSGGYRIYSPQEIEMITHAFLNYASRVMKGESGETLMLSGFFSPEEMMRILITAHAVLWMLYAKEYGISISGGFLFGFFEAFALIMKQIGAGIKL